jgi:hypothetical protein
LIFLVFFTFKTQKIVFLDIYELPKTLERFGAYLKNDKYVARYFTERFLLEDSIKKYTDIDISDFSRPQK